jgi:hypothetical protein
MDTAPGRYPSQYAIGRAGSDVGRFAVYEEQVGRTAIAGRESLQRTMRPLAQELIFGDGGPALSYGGAACLRRRLQCPGNYQ